MLASMAGRNALFERADFGVSLDSQVNIVPGQVSVTSLEVVAGAAPDCGR